LIEFLPLIFSTSSHPTTSLPAKAHLSPSTSTSNLSVSTQSPLPFIRGGSSDVVLAIFGFLIQFDSI
jgi:hypothetical protein